MLYNVLGGHIISHIAVFTEMWKTQGKSLKLKLFILTQLSKTTEIFLSWSSSHFLEWENISGVRSFDFYVMFTT